jgi:hypothetical protein
MAPPVESGVQLRVRGFVAEQGALEHVDERAHGQLRDEPDQVGREPLVHGDGPNGDLIAFERRGQQRTGIDARLIKMSADPVCGFAGASPSQRRAQREQRWFQHWNRQRNRFARKGWNATLELCGEVSGRQRKSRHASALDELGQICHQTEQFVLKSYCWLKFRPTSKKSRPPIGCSAVAGLASSLRQRDVSHGSSMV